MGKKSRTKGASGEREVVKLLKAYGFDEAYRAASAQRAQGSRVCDVEGTDWWVEVKRAKRPNIHAAIAQAKNERDTRPVAVFTRRDGDEWLVTMPASEWLGMVCAHAQRAETLGLALGLRDGECSHCNGQGFVTPGVEEWCEVCGGTGESDA